MAIALIDDQCINDQWEITKGIWLREGRMGIINIQCSIFNVQWGHKGNPAAGGVENIQYSMCQYSMINGGTQYGNGKSQ